MMGSLMFMLGEDMSIFALKTMAPSGYFPAFISRNRRRFSSTGLSLYGEGVPGSVRVPRVAVICSGVSSQTYALPSIMYFSAISYSLS